MNGWYMGWWLLLAVFLRCCRIDFPSRRI
jgi:hypothetical protein